MKTVAALIAEAASLTAYESSVGTPSEKWAYEARTLIGELAEAMLDELDGLKARVESAEDALRHSDESLKHAVKVIEQHVPRDALGTNSDGDLNEAHLTRSWPLLDEYLHYMGESVDIASAHFTKHPEGKI